MAMILAILLLAVMLFVTEWLRVDLVALVVLVSLVLTGLVTPEEAISGFSNPAVVTVWAVFILSGGLSRTGVASLVGRYLLRLAKHGEVRLLMVIMLAAGVLSAFMNNVGVAALLLPVVMDLARRTGTPPSKLLIPLSYAVLLGGLTTLIGTPPNILISNLADGFGVSPFRFFDFTPVGLSVMFSGMAFMALLGRHLLPTRDLSKGSVGRETDLKNFFNLDEQIFVVALGSDSLLAGKSLAQSRLGSALGLIVISIIRDGQTHLAPHPNKTLRSGDRLLVQGHPDQFSEFRGQQLVVKDEDVSVERLVSTEINVAEVRLSVDSALLGHTLKEVDFRGQNGVNVLAIWRQGLPRSSHLQDTPLQTGDILLVQAARARLDELREDPNIVVSRIDRSKVYQLNEKLMLVGVPGESHLVGKTLSESRLGDAFGVTVLGIVREGKTLLMPQPSEELSAGDTLLVEGELDDLVTMRGLQSLEMESQASPDLSELESGRIGLTEVVLTPHTTLVGKTVGQLHLREKYGLSVLAIWREGEVYRTNLRDLALRFGDALLFHGPREKLTLLGDEPDFLVLTGAVQEVPLLHKAPIATLVMASVVLVVILGWLPIYISAVAGATVMVLTGCLTMDEAYRSIEWRAVFLIAGMLPLGVAIQDSGTALFMAEAVLSPISGLGPLAVLAGLFVITALAAQVMPTPAVAVLMAPIAFNTAAGLGMSPQALLMTVAVSASASFMSPVAHPANMLVMGPGGYRFTDYTKIGFPLTLVVLVVVLLVLPIFWPLYP